MAPDCYADDRAMLARHFAQTDIPKIYALLHHISEKHFDGILKKGDVLISLVDGDHSFNNMLLSMVSELGPGKQKDASRKYTIVFLLPSSNDRK